jgi:membrane protein involved in colicin uptake
MELGGFEEYIGRLMRDPAIVQQEAQQAAQQQLQSEIAVDQPKRDTDLKKTQMKSITSLEQERMRQQGESSRNREKNKVELIDQILNAAQERSQKNA